MFVGYVRREHRIASLVMLDKKNFTLPSKESLSFAELYTQIRYEFSVMLNFDCFCQLSEAD